MAATNDFVSSRLDDAEGADLDDRIRELAGLGKNEGGTNYNSIETVSHLLKQCHKCEQGIRGRVLRAMDRFYHPRCFECSKCAQLIEEMGEGFAVLDDEPVCAKCMRWMEADQSGRGGPDTKGARTVGAGGAGGRSGAPGSSSRSPAGGSGAAGGSGTSGPTTRVVKDGVTAAEADAIRDTIEETKAASGGNHCTVCGKSVITAIELEGNLYCHSCFRCDGCSDVIDPSQGFLPMGDLRYCANCASSIAATGLPPSGAGSGSPASSGPGSGGSSGAPGGQTCGKCSNPIVGKFVRVEGEPWHKNCFVCGDCEGSLAEGYAKMGGKYVCGDCANRRSRGPRTAGPAVVTHGIRYDHASNKAYELDADGTADTSSARVVGSSWAPPTAAERETAAARGPTSVGVPSSSVFGFCTECGKSNPESKNFCGECGTDLRK